MKMQHSVMYIVLQMYYFSHVIATVITFDENNLEGFTSEELDVLEEAVKTQETKLFSQFGANIECEDLACTITVEFNLGSVQHSISLEAGLLPETLGAYIVLRFDSYELWDEEIHFNAICTGLPYPLNKVDICLEAYNVSFMSLPNEAAICLRTELTLIFPLILIDFNCLKYEKGKGVFFDWSLKPDYKGWLDININGGKPIITLNTPIPQELIVFIIRGIENQRKKIVALRHELVKQVKENIEEQNWWNAFLASLAAGSTTGLGIR